MDLGRKLWSLSRVTTKLRPGGTKPARATLLWDCEPGPLQVLLGPHLKGVFAQAKCPELHNVGEGAVDSVLQPGKAVQGRKSDPNRWVSRAPGLLR